MCKKLITVLMVGFIIAGFTSILQASELLNFTYSGNGARAGAMGYAFTGIADDATAIAWNAAGLTQLYSMEACAIGRFGFGSWSVDGWEDAPDIETSSQFQLNFASFVFPFKAGDYNIVGGLAFRNIFDFNNEYTEKYDDGDKIWTGDGGVNAITPAIAIQANDMISVGAALNIYTGSYDYSFKNERTGYEYEYEAPTSTFSGTSFDLGLMVKPNDQFSIGANLNFPYTLTRDIEDDQEYEIDVPFFFSVGAAFKATDQLTLAFDYHSRSWSNSDSLQKFMELEYPDHYNSMETNLNSIHVGLEYLLTSGDSVIPLRLGYYTHPIHKWDYNYDQVVNSVFTLGAGLVMNNFVFDGAFEFEPASIDIGEGGSLDQNNFRMTLGGTFHFGN